MIMNSKQAEEAAVLDVAKGMCVAARTAPKGKGVDELYTCVVSGDDLEALAAEMERLAEPLGYKFFLRDAKNIRQSLAVVLIGTALTQRGLGESCALCNHKGCAACKEGNGVCAFNPIDLGIALGAAAAYAADNRVDNRIMFSAAKAALSLGHLPGEVKIAMAIPLSVSGKSPYFDR